MYLKIHCIAIVVYVVDQSLKNSNNKKSMTTSWTNIGPSGASVGGRTRAILVQNTSPLTLYAGAAAGGVWKSQDAGNTWTPLTDLMANIAISTLAATPTFSLIIAGTGEGFWNNDAKRGVGIFTSSNGKLFEKHIIMDAGGSTWTQLSSTSNSNFYYVNKIVISPQNNNILYVATGTALAISSNAGSSWTYALTSTYGFADVVVANNAGVDYVYTWACTTSINIYFNMLVGFGLYVSTNGGSTWTLAVGSSTYNEAYWLGSFAVAPSNNAIACISVSYPLWIP